MRELSELIDVDDPVWPSMRDDIANSSARVLPGDAGECLVRLQVTVRSVLGALNFHTGGLVIDGGWLRVFAGPNLAWVNNFPTGPDPAWSLADGLVVGHDVLGGVFAMNGPDPAAHGRPGEPGEITYFAPDSLEWESMDGGFGAWVSWLLSDEPAGFYRDLRWPGWEQEVSGLDQSQGLSIVPFLWSEEAQTDLAATSRRGVPMAELLGLHAEFCEQFDLPAPGFLGRPLA